MMMLREVLNNARQRRVAVGHFNVADLVTLKAATEVARDMRVPVLIGTSEGERAFLGVREIAAVVASLRRRFSHPIFLNGDHTHSVEAAVEAAKAGYDMIGFDASALPMDANVKVTREAVAAVKAVNPDILVEGELGNIGTGSEIHDEVPESSRILTEPDDAKAFAEATHIDALAPAVGNMHGLLKSMIAGEEKKRINIGRIGELAAATGLPLTLHGGSGTAEDDFRKGVAAGLTIVHINTELRVAWRHGIASALAEQPDEVVPYKIYATPLKEMQKVVADRLRLFNGL